MQNLVILGQMIRV